MNQKIAFKTFEITNKIENIREIFMILIIDNNSAIKE